MKKPPRLVKDETGNGITEKMRIKDPHCEAYMQSLVIGCRYRPEGLRNARRGERGGVPTQWLQGL